MDEFASIVFEGFAIGLVLEVLLNLMFLACCAVIPVGGNWIADGWLSMRAQHKFLISILIKVRSRQSNLALFGRRVRALILPLNILEARDVLIRRLRLIVGRYAVEESRSCSGRGVILESWFAARATLPRFPVLWHGRLLHVLQINEDLLALLIHNFERRLIIWHRTCAHFGNHLGTAYFANFLFQVWAHQQMLLEVVGHLWRPLLLHEIIIIDAVDGLIAELKTLLHTVVGVDSVAVWLVLVHRWLAQLALPSMLQLRQLPRSFNGRSSLSILVQLVGRLSHHQVIAANRMACLMGCRRHSFLISSIK